jgi:hypothetical protein
MSQTSTASISSNGAATTGSRWTGVGHSSDPDPKRAGHEAVQRARKGADPKLLLVFCSNRYDLSTLAREIQNEAPGAKLIGCSTAGEIAASGPGDAGVVVMAIGGEGVSVATAAAAAASTRLREAGAEVASCMGSVGPRSHRVLLLLTDGLAGDQQEIVRGAYSVVGAAVPLVGGCAGDSLEMRETFQLFGDQVLGDSVVAAAISSDGPMGIGVRHGWRELGDPMLVTKSSDTRVYALDDRPALDVYLELLEAPPEARTDASAFTQFALTHPLGMRHQSEESQIRFVADANFEDRSIGCIAEVPQGALVWFMEGDSDSVLKATDAACTAALESLEGRDPIGLVAFDCIARRGVLGEEGIKREVDRISVKAGGAPVAGFYTYGEIARTRGISGFHNQTLVVLAMG